jgi:hypothetical protein
MMPMVAFDTYVYMCGNTTWILLDRDGKRRMMSEKSGMECKLMNAHREIDGLKEKLAQAVRLLHFKGGGCSKLSRHLIHFYAIHRSLCSQQLDDHDRARSLLIRFGEKCFNPSSPSGDDGISHDLLYHLDRMK